MGRAGLDESGYAFRAPRPRHTNSVSHEPGRRPGHAGRVAWMGLLSGFWPFSHRLLLGI